MGNTERANPADKVYRRKVSSLTPFANNSRLHTDHQIDEIARSIEQWGWTIPVLVDTDDGIIAGHARVRAAERLGLVDVPVLVAKGWTDEQKRAYVIADNNLALNADWDIGTLEDEVAALNLEGFDMSLLGFDSEELAEMLKAPTFGPGKKSDQGRLDAPPAGQPATCPECGHEFTIQASFKNRVG